MALRLVLAERRLVHVGARRLVANDELLLRHDLEQLERGGVARVAAQRFGDLADGAGAAGPEDAQDGELGVGRSTSHAPHLLRRRSYLSTKIFVARPPASSSLSHWPSSGTCPVSCRPRGGCRSLRPAGSRKPAPAPSR